ncbi:hypothetical protein JMY81_07415 [Brenneria goodwinii]|uniref:hypothetical protein n=1 Tax=Brenneria goodwinii TaxID=1109412 RepID=UPI000EF1B197|nr:hypothetical protein [Brenneria goodwinii]MCG8155834.1 hypothetical protein [Brenneria goodwinii]MCG8160666.1 hypothetical protein [Brenneria goodwinii]MCG8166896.1 hypothetical protein [Brenneria goodwinii]MCG8172808.1 hypothetical protein [Brenneria goodwinii]MCG8177207.1 hypothetical protein [Brenneria goodwinii]
MLKQAPGMKRKRVLTCLLIAPVRDKRGRLLPITGAFFARNERANASPIRLAPPVITVGAEEKVATLNTRG